VIQEVLHGLAEQLLILVEDGALHVAHANPISHHVLCTARMTIDRDAIQRDIGCGQAV
jgi:hypothetical protein